jgi:photosystem II stability/assembly factor-like uncharacterized protein
VLSEPSNVTVSTVTGISSQINLSWNPPTIDGGFPITNYNYDYQYYDISNSVWSNYSSPVSVGSSTRTILFKELFADTSYSFQVRAINSKGISFAARSSVIRTNKWTGTRLNPSIINSDFSLTANASSSDGSILAIASNGNYIYTSVDSGNNWNQRATNTFWGMSICISSDGIKMAAASHTAVFISTNSGVSWFNKSTTILGTFLTNSMCMSSDGGVLMVGANAGYVYITTDLGTTWRTITTLGTGNWRAVACSSDGTKLVAGLADNNIFTSIDTGYTWTRRTNITNGGFKIGLNSNGSILIVTNWNSINISLDFGNSWTNVFLEPNNLMFFDLAMSSNGTKIFAVTRTNGILYTSINSGTTWVRDTQFIVPNSDWPKISSSSDGTKLFYTISKNDMTSSNFIYTIK